MLTPNQEIKSITEEMRQIISELVISPEYAFKLGSLCGRLEAISSDNTIEIKKPPTEASNKRRSKRNWEQDQEHRRFIEEIWEQILPSTRERIEDEINPFAPRHY